MKQVGQAWEPQPLIGVPRFKAVNLSINYETRVPIYVQIVEQIKSGIASGEFAVGTRLTPVRKLALQLDISRLTVFRAYTELQDEGLVKGTPGRGTVVAPIKDGAIARDFLLKFVKDGPVIGFEQTSKQSNIRSLATDSADPQLFDAERWLVDTFELRKSSDWLFYYPEFLGEPEMRSAGARLFRKWKPDLDDEDIVITGRFTDTLNLLSRWKFEPGTHMIFDEPHTLFAEDLFTSLGFIPHGVSVHEDGIDLEQFEMLAKSHSVKLAYVEPTFGLCNGRVWSEENRKSFLKIADKYGITILERLSTKPIDFRASDEPCLFSLAPEMDIIAEHSFSHSLAPGIGLTASYVPVQLRKWYEEKRPNIGMPPDKVIQLSMAKMIKNGLLDAHFERVVPVYKARRDALASALRIHLPEISFVNPLGGYSTVLDLPRAIDSKQIFEDSIAAGVAVMPCRFLTTRGRGDDKVRLSYSMQNPEAIRQAVKQWAPVLKSHINGFKKTGTM